MLFLDGDDVDSRQNAAAALSSIVIQQMGPPYNLIMSIEQLRTMDTRGVVHLVVLVLAFVVTKFGRHVYMPIIYQNGINDFGLADSIGNRGESLPGYCSAWHF